MHTRVYLSTGLRANLAKAVPVPHPATAACLAAPLPRRWGHSCLPAPGPAVCSTNSPQPPQRCRRSGLGRVAQREFCYHQCPVLKVPADRHPQSWPAWVPLIPHKADKTNNWQRVRADDRTERKSDSDTAAGHKQHTRDTLLKCQVLVNRGRCTVGHSRTSSS